VEGDLIPQQALETTEQIDAADVVVGILADLDQEAVATVHEALRTLHGDLRIVILSSDGSSVQAQADSASSGNRPQLSVVPWPLIGPDASGAPLQSISAAYHSIFAAGERLGARAGCIIASKLEAVTPQWVCQLMQPVLEAEFDLAAPYYARRKFEGLLNSGVICPLIRCLYGKRIQNPLGPDLGFSRALFGMLRGSDRNANRIHPLASLAPVAICDNLRVCQVHVGPRILPPTDWTNISSLLVQALGPVFLAMERNAACWQKARGSVPVSGFGEPLAASDKSVTVDVNQLLNSFQLGTRDLQEVWGLVLPPATLLELRRLARSTPEQFQMPDELWARIVYDFALAHRLRTINREHLLRSMTPLYLGWAAGYAREVEAADGAAVERRLERLSTAYEVSKPYLVSRWRWPDRFNP
jgi:glucosylglycerate synthase